MRLESRIMFDTLEQRTLARAAIHVRIAFPTDGLDLRDTQIWREYGGRHLMTLGRARSFEPFTHTQIVGALTALATLERVLEKESDPHYWRRTLRSRKGELSPRVQEFVSVIAPGHDPSIHLAEIRQGQLREVHEALPILREAQQMLGGPSPDDKYQEV